MEGKITKKKISITEEAFEIWDKNPDLLLPVKGKRKKQEGEGNIKKQKKEESRYGKFSRAMELAFDIDHKLMGCIINRGILGIPDGILGDNTIFPNFFQLASCGTTSCGDDPIATIYSYLFYSSDLWDGELYYFDDEEKQLRKEFREKIKEKYITKRKYLDRVTEVLQLKEFPFIF